MANTPNPAPPASSSANKTAEERKTPEERKAAESRELKSEEDRDHGRDKARDERRTKLRDAEPIVDEQRQRSRELEIEGTAAWVAAHDERPEDERPVLHKGTLPTGDTLDSPPEKQRQVPGVSTPMKDDGTGNKKLAP